MNTKNIALVVAGVALAGGAGYYFYKRSKSQQLVSAYGPTAPGSQGVIQAGQNIISTGQSLINQLLNRQPSSPSELEGKLIRVDRDVVYLVKNNLLHNVVTLPTIDGKYDWTRPVPIEVKSKDINIPEGENYPQMIAREGSSPSASTAYIDPSQPWAGSMAMSGLGNLPALLMFN